MICKGFEVLHDGGEMELVARTREAPEAHPLEAVMGFQVRKAHLNLLALISRSVELRCLHQRAGVIAGIFVDVSRDSALRGVWAALGLDGT